MIAALLAIAASALVSLVEAIRLPGAAYSTTKSHEQPWFGRAA